MFILKSGSIVEGNNSIINARLQTAKLCAIGSYSTIKNLTINSTNPDRKNNRIDLTDKHHITINNCKFTGFRQTTLDGDTNYNVWALFFRNTKNVSLTNCVFGNNSFEDIIIEYSCENLHFENLTSEETYILDNVASMKSANNLKVGDYVTTKGYSQASDGKGAYYLIRERRQNDIDINDGVGNVHFIGNALSAEEVVRGIRVDIEPSSDISTSNIMFENCVIDFIHTTDYYYTGNTTKNITCSNCIIDTLAYHGADLILDNCVINTMRPLIIDNKIYGGNLKIINSCSFSENLIKDPYFDTVAMNNTNSYWNVSYASAPYKTLLGTIVDEEGIFTVLNPDNLLKNIYITTPKIDITPNEKILLRTFSKSKYPKNGTTTGSQSLHIVIRYIGTYYNPRTEQNVEDAELSSITASINRSPVGTITPLCEQNTLIRIPEKIAVTIPPRENVEEEPLTIDVIPHSVMISYRNGGEGAQALYLRECGLYRIKPTTIGLTRNLPEISNRKKRIFNSNIIPTSYYNKYNLGDIMYFNNPVDYIGAVCTDASNWGGTWKKFGSLETS